MRQTLTLWTIQNKKKWEIFEKTSLLIADPSFVYAPFLTSYAWLEKMMLERIGSPEFGNKHPIWAWYKIDGRKRKPDLRRSGYFRRGEEAVLIEFEVDSSQVLLTDFSDWHIILNSWSEEDIVSESTTLDMEGLSLEDLEQPWKKVDDNMILYWKDIILDPSSPLKDIQATVWEVKMDQVKKVTHFKSK